MTGYPRFTSIQAAKKAFRRKRRDDWFILTGNQNPRCAHCGNPIQDFSGQDERGEALHKEGYRNNRMLYVAKHKAVIPFHYVCMWQAALNQICNYRFK